MPIFPHSKRLKLQFGCDALQLPFVYRLAEFSFFYPYKTWTLRSMCKLVQFVLHHSQVTYLYGTSSPTLFSKCVPHKISLVILLVSTVKGRHSFKEDERRVKKCHP